MKVNLSEYELTFLIIMLDERTKNNHSNDSWPGWNLLSKLLDALHIDEALEDLQNGAKDLKNDRIITFLVHCFRYCSFSKWSFFWICFVCNYNGKDV